VSEAENRRSGGGTYANMLDAHPPFQIDGNFGAVSGIAGMLLQESGSRLYLLPALPTAWKNGSVCGLRAPNRIEVSLWWSEGKLEKALLRSPVDQKVQLVIDGCECCAEISGGGYVWTRS
jgi:alpha-L-fucosidase 2